MVWTPRDRSMLEGRSGDGKKGKASVTETIPQAFLKKRYHGHGGGHGTATRIIRKFDKGGHVEQVGGGFEVVKAEVSRDKTAEDEHEWSPDELMDLFDGVQMHDSTRDSWQKIANDPKLKELRADPKRQPDELRSKWQSIVRDTEALRVNFGYYVPTLHKGTSSWPPPHGYLHFHPHGSPRAHTHR